MHKNKKHKIVLLMYENFNEEIQKILVDDTIDYLILLYFTSNMKKNLLLLEESRKFFFNINTDEFMKNIFIFSQREFLANDLLVRGVITPKNIEAFDYFKFITLYEYGNYPNIEEFLLANRKEFAYSLDLYEKKDPWLYYKNKTGVLVVSEKTQNKILENYHKVRVFIPEIIIAILGGKDDESLIKILKLIGADAHIIIGVINRMVVPYSKRTDAYFFVDNDNYEEFCLKFLNNFLEIEGLEKLREFLQIPVKNFEADMTYDEEREIEKKKIKYYRLELDKGDTLKMNIDISKDRLLLNNGLNKKYILSKI